MTNFIESLASALFMPWIVAALFLTGIFLTIRLRAVQFVRFPEAVRTMLATHVSGQQGALVPFQAFMTALAGSIGVGNIAGVATAIVSGGPGALFWIWCYGLVAMAIKFAEATLGTHFREVTRTGVLSGPMYTVRGLQ